MTSLSNFTMTKLLRTLLFMIIALIAFEAAASEPVKGYRGFVELSAAAKFKKKYAHGSHDIVNSISGINTTHGYQFNEHFFAGGGIGINVLTSNYDWFAWGIGFPIYAAGRADWKIGKVPLFADMRLGTFLSSGGTTNSYYFNPSIGYRCSWGRKISLNIGVGGALHWFESYPGYDCKLMPSVKLGIEFH